MGKIGADGLSMFLYQLIIRKQYFKQLWWYSMLNLVSWLGLCLFATGKSEFRIMFGPRVLWVVFLTHMRREGGIFPLWVSALLCAAGKKSHKWRRSKEHHLVIPFTSYPTHVFIYLLLLICGETYCARPNSICATRKVDLSLCVYMRPSLDLTDSDAFSRRLIEQTQ